MQSVNPGFIIRTPISEGGEAEIRNIEQAARVCYKSEPKTDDISECAKFVDRLIRRGHLAMLEHGSLSVIFTTDRCVSHEMVRQRMASFAQESTRWCNYANDRFGAEIKIIEPDFSGAKDPEEALKRFRETVKEAEETYNWLIKEQGVSPQIARRVLPHCLKTEIVITANYREWMHIFELRCAKDVDPEFRELAIGLLNEVRECIPVIFDRCATYLYKEEADKNAGT